MLASPSTGRSPVLPPLISYNSAAELKRALGGADQLSGAESEAFNELVQAGFPPLVNIGVFGLVLGISPKLLSAMALFRDTYYRSFHIRKRTGGKRKILAPRTYLKVVQKFILRRILERQSLPQFVTGFIKSRSIVQNASLHVGSKYFLNIDLRDFFGTVQEKQVLRVFKRVGYPEKMAAVLTKLCTYGGALPQGAPSSPYLANLVFLPIDKIIQNRCESLRIKYSRYADDLTFSRKSPLPDTFLNGVEKVIINHGFEINHTKTRYSRPGQPSYVTGLIVSHKVQPDKRTRKLLRAMFHNALSHPEKVRNKRDELRGWASYVKGYDSELGENYLAIAKSI
jgi:RNA-directed DNA polymerase